MRLSQCSKSRIFLNLPWKSGYFRCINSPWSRLQLCVWSWLLAVVGKIVVIDLLITLRLKNEAQPGQNALGKAPKFSNFWILTIFFRYRFSRPYQCSSAVPKATNLNKISEVGCDKTSTELTGLRQFAANTQIKDNASHQMCRRWRRCCW